MVMNDMNMLNGHGLQFLDLVGVNNHGISTGRTACMYCGSAADPHLILLCDSPVRPHPK